MMWSYYFGTSSSVSTAEASMAAFIFLKNVDGLQCAWTVAPNVNLANLF